MPNTMMTAADKLSNRTTAFSTFSALLAACRNGYTPSLRRSDRAQAQLGEMLQVAGCRVFWG